jgi:hypothetical protein
MIDPISIAILLDGAGKSIGAALTQIQSARNYHRLIKSNEEIGRKAGLNQLMIAEMQIRNLQELEEKKRETHVRIADKKIQADRELADLAAMRQLSIEQLKIETSLLIQQLDHQQQTELEKFRSQEHFASLQWRTDREREFRLETAELVNKVRENIALENRIHSEKMIGYKQLHEKSWPLRNPSLIYLQPGDDRLLFLLSPPVVTFRESEDYKFPQLETFLGRIIRIFLTGDYENLIDIDTGSWLNKDFRGNTALKPLALELVSRSVVVFDSYLSGYPFGGDLVNLSVAYKGTGYQAFTFVDLISDHRYRPEVKELPVDWETLADLWAFLHTAYAAIYTDLHYFQAGEPRNFGFLRVLENMVRDEKFGSFLKIGQDAITTEAAALIQKIFQQALQGIGQLFYLNQASYIISLALANDLYEILPGAVEDLAEALKQSFAHWTLQKSLSLADLFDEAGEELLLTKISDSDLAYLQEFVNAAKKIKSELALTTRIAELLNVIKNTRSISL